MSYDYEKLYAAEADALGGQTPQIAAFLAAIAPEPQRILDVGCGQGRDALPLARAGHSVVGVDLAPSGVKAMCEAAQREGFDVTGHVGDITHYAPAGLFDVVLVDRTLHMLGEAERLMVLHRLVGAVRVGGWLVIADETSNLPAFRDVLEADSRLWEVERCGKGQLFAQQTGEGPTSS